MKLRFAALFSAVALALTGCGLAGGNDTAVGTKDGDKTKLVVATSITPQGDIMKFVADNLAADAGLEIEVSEQTDYTIPNRMLVDGEVDANYFQHVPYLDSEREGQGYDIYNYPQGIHLEPMALYSKKYKSADELPDGAKIGINNDPANQGRALSILVANDLITFKEGTDPITATIHDVDENKKNFEFIEAEAATLARTLDDTDASFINGNNALNAGLSSKKDGLIVESPQDNPYSNILAVRAGTENDPALQKLNELVHSDEVRSFIEETWPEGEVLPAF